jgi:hypothetical protein
MSSISQDAKVVFYDCKLHGLDPEVHITTKDFGLSTDSISTHLKLPLDELRTEIPAAIREYSWELAEENAMNLLDEHGPQRVDRDYQPMRDLATLPLVQEPSKSATRSNRRQKHAMEEPDKPITSRQKRRKQGKTYRINWFTPPWGYSP